MRICRIKCYFGFHDWNYDWGYTTLDCFWSATWKNKCKCCGERHKDSLSKEE